MVFFEAPHRLVEFLADAARELGADRRAAVCRELTKPFEEVVRGTLAELAEWAENGARGEITVVVSGAPPMTTSTQDALALVRRAMSQGDKLSAAVADVAKATGVNRKELYAAALADKENR